MSAANRPNLFLIGAPKCGTTALAQYLAQREDVFFCTPKEPFFLCDDFPNLRKMTFVEDEAAYLALFDAADPSRHRYLAEGSTSYLRSAVAARRALEISPDARFIIMLRNPVEIAHAFHMEQIYDLNEDVNDFEAAWGLQDRRRHGREIPKRCRAPEFLQYREVAAIGTQLAHFFDVIPRDRALVLFHDDLRDDPRSLWLRTLEFLDLPDDGRTDFPAVNASRRHRFKWLANFVLDPPDPIRSIVYRARQWLNQQRPPLVERLKASLRREHRRPPLSADFKEALLLEFEPEVAKIEALVGRDLQVWLRREKAKSRALKA